METKINQDGSGTKSFVLALDNSVTSMLESVAQEAGADPNDLWETARAGAESIDGAMVEDYRDDESQGIKITVPFSDLDELQALSGVDAFAGSDVVTVSQNGAITTLKATVRTGDLTAAFDDLEGFDLGDVDIAYTYSVQVEGVILAYAPQGNAVAEGSKVTWNLTQSAGDTTELMIQWEPSSGPDSPVILLGVLASSAAALIGARVFLILRRKRAPDQRSPEKG
jgi:hypothetical protein